ncbi:hypothetical protein BCR39DRAFT_161521 [Naematelia encephala]|uniref:Uncharacterized protein n=1 Tax=Naematelia encephala TaxID=71784 RepID=A0A1Y2B4X0_9TREE|nr:hypothetical protein BCR39DRAFT_161521 [Naematelia encephala]
MITYTTSFLGPSGILCDISPHSKTTINLIGPTVSPSTLDRRWPPLSLSKNVYLVPQSDQNGCPKTPFSLVDSKHVPNHLRGRSFASTTPIQKRDTTSYF